jgi:hypothetical protein
MHTGIDYCGHFKFYQGKRRGKFTHMAYIDMFVCFMKGTLHLEVAGLITATFIVALRRLMARYGKYACIYSDSATSFITAQ